MDNLFQHVILFCNHIASRLACFQIFDISYLSSYTIWSVYHPWWTADAGLHQNNPKADNEANRPASQKKDAKSTSETLQWADMSFESQTYLVKGIRINIVIDLHVRSVSEGIESAVRSSFSIWRSIKTQRGEESTRNDSFAVHRPKHGARITQPTCIQKHKPGSFDCPMSLHGGGFCQDRQRFFSMKVHRKTKGGGGG